MSTDAPKAPKRKVVEVVAPSVEVGLAVGARVLGKSADRADYEVVEDSQGDPGGDFGKVKIRVHASPPEPRVDGKFLIGCRVGLFHLIITPSSGDGRSVEREQLKTALSRLPLPDGVDAVWEAELAKPSGKPVVLMDGHSSEATCTVDAAELVKDGTEAPVAAEEDEPEPEYLGPPFTILVTDDQMQVWLLNSDLKFDTTVDREAVDEVLEGLGVTFGISEALLDRAVARPLTTAWQIAQGVESVNGGDGVLEFQFKAHLGLTDDQMEELNTVDWYELFSLDQILSGEALVMATPATEGTSGTTVLGAVLAGGDIQVEYVQGGEVTAGGDLTVGDDIVRANVGVLGKITVAGRGRIVGGRVSAGTEITATSIGAPTGVRTVVAVGNPGSEAKTVEALLEARVLSQMGADGGLPEADDEAEEEIEVNGEGDGDEEEKVGRGPRVIVSGEIHEDTVVGIGSPALVLDRRIDHCMLRESEGRIQVFPL